MTETIQEVVNQIVSAAMLSEDGRNIVKTNLRDIHNELKKMDMSIDEHAICKGLVFSVQEELEKERRNIDWQAFSIKLRNLLETLAIVEHHHDVRQQDLEEA